VWGGVVGRVGEGNGAGGGGRERDGEGAVAGRGGAAFGEARIGDAERRCGVVVDDDAAARAVRQGGAARGRQHQAETLVGRHEVIGDGGDRDRLLRLAGGEGERAGLRHVVPAGDRRAVRRGVLHRHRRSRRGRQAQ